MLACRSIATASPPTARGRTFAALSDARYRLLWLGGVFSFLSVQMQVIARGWVAEDLTGTNTGLGAVYLGFGLPMLLCTPWGGVVADRLSKRAVLMGSQAALALSSLAVAVAISTGAIEYWMLIAQAAVQGVGFSFLGPARMAFTGELVGRERLSNAIVLQQMSMNGTRIVGPSVAGALIGVAFFGAGGVYYLTAAFMFASMAVTFQLPHGRPAADRPVASPLSELTDGIRYVKNRPLVALLVATSFMVVMVAFPYIAFLPRLAKIHEAGASGYGMLSAASAVGALLASLLIAGRAGGPGTWRLQAVAGVLFGVGVGLLGVAPGYLAALGAILVTGAASSAFQSLNNALVLENTDLEYHGRVQSLMMLSFSGFGMAALPIGAVADTVGLRTTMLGQAAVAVVAVLVYAGLRRKVRAVDPGVEHPGGGDGRGARPGFTVPAA